MIHRQRDLYVFAGTYAEAVTCIKEMNWDTDSWAFIAEVKVLDGTVKPDVVYSGSFMLREDRDEVEQAMYVAEARRILFRLADVPKIVTKVTK